MWPFFEFVKNFPALYDKTSSEYHNPCVRSTQRYALKLAINRANPNLKISKGEVKTIVKRYRKFINKTQQNHLVAHFHNMKSDSINQFHLSNWESKRFLY
ncbi:hypothetical protein O0L34_g10082 [Tuta absoluta]|nr:hypothetical protein O0L34_g10082 [Tuta absoluta]